MASESDTASWESARLIPVSGIRNAEEQERRAASALLAVLSAVDEFGFAITKPYGAPKGRLQAYIEVPFELDDGRRVRPDGLIEVTRGKRSWTALIEVKTGSNELARDQIEAYLDVAKEQGFDCVITISNQIARIPGEHPVEVDKRKLRKVSPGAMLSPRSGVSMADGFDLSAWSPACRRETMAPGGFAMWTSTEDRS